LQALSNFIEYLILGEKYAHFIESSTLMSVLPAFLIGLLSADRPFQPAVHRKKSTV
jgi:hypothetical protein